MIVTEPQTISGLDLYKTLEAALLALPAPRLLNGAMLDVEDNGQPICCAVGALGKYCGVPEPMLNSSDEAGEMVFWEQVLYLPDGVGIIRANDYNKDETEETRYIRMLAWTRQMIAMSETREN